MPKRKFDDSTKPKTVSKRPVDTAAPVDVRDAKGSTKPGVPAQAHERTDTSFKRLKRTARPSEPANVSKELSSLAYPTPHQNKHLPKLPANTTISKRPINHGPIASRFAGADVPKVVYVSRKTPVISAVKRVKQFLREIEKRAMQSLGLDGVLSKTAGGRHGDGDFQRKLDEVSEKLSRDGEKVLVKASGRAIEQALRIGDWFRNKEEEMLCQVEVQTGSVSVIDDIVEADEDGGAAQADKDEDEDSENGVQEASTVMLDMGETTMELLGNLEKNNNAMATEKVQAPGTEAHAQDGSDEAALGPKRKRRRKKRKEYDPEDIPEARLRWVKTVEIAISLRA